MHVHSIDDFGNETDHSTEAQFFHEVPSYSDIDYQVIATNKRIASIKLENVSSNDSMGYSEVSSCSLEYNIPQINYTPEANNLVNCYNQNLVNQTATYPAQSNLGDYLASNCNFVSSTTGPESHASPQSELLSLNFEEYDDPLNSSFNSVLSDTSPSINSNTYISAITGANGVSSTQSYFCLWQDCNHHLFSQQELVQHIEKAHIYQRRLTNFNERDSNEYLCLWLECPRQLKPFNARYKLLIHMRVHSGEKPNRCHYANCTKAFSRLENLKIHSRSHTGERPYHCQQDGCLKAFSNSSDRAKHEKTHKEAKPYKCRYVGCTKKYTDPSSLRKHNRTHTHPGHRYLQNKLGDNSFKFSSMFNQSVLHDKTTNTYGSWPNLTKPSDFSNSFQFLDSSVSSCMSSQNFDRSLPSREIKYQRPLSMAKSYNGQFSSDNQAMSSLSISQTNGLQAAFSAIQGFTEEHKKMLGFTNFNTEKEMIN